MNKLYERSLTGLLLLTLLLSGGLLSAQNDILREIVKKNSGINTIRSNFRQVKHISFFEDSLVSTGIFLFKRPGKMVWKYQTPFLYAIIIDGDTVVIRDGKNVKRFDTGENVMFEQIKQVIFNMVSGKMINDSGYDVSAAKGEKYYEIQMAPKSKTLQKYLKRIDLFIDKKSLDVVRIKMNETSGDYTYIYFVNREINVPVSDTSFVP